MLKASIAALSPANSLTLVPLSPVTSLAFKESSSSFLTAGGSTRLTAENFSSRDFIMVGTSPVLASLKTSGKTSLIILAALIPWETSAPALPPPANAPTDWAAELTSATLYPLISLRTASLVFDLSILETEALPFKVSDKASKDEVVLSKDSEILSNPDSILRYLSIIPSLAKVIALVLLLNSSNELAVSASSAANSLPLCRFFFRPSGVLLSLANFSGSALCACAILSKEDSSSTPEYLSS